jgi:predicted nucleic acid-binding Zn ribbon protein
MERAPPLAACINCGTPLSSDARRCGVVALKSHPAW